jgi:hypothetical protein
MLFAVCGWQIFYLKRWAVLPVIKELVAPLTHLSPPSSLPSLLFARFFEVKKPQVSARFFFHHPDVDW